MNKKKIYIILCNLIDILLIIFLWILLIFVIVNVSIAKLTTWIWIIQVFLFTGTLISSKFSKYFILSLLFATHGLLWLQSLLVLLWCIYDDGSIIKQNWKQFGGKFSLGIIETGNNFMHHFPLVVFFIVLFRKKEDIQKIFLNFYEKMNLIIERNDDLKYLSYFYNITQIFSSWFIFVIYVIIFRAWNQYNISIPMFLTLLYTFLFSVPINMILLFSIIFCDNNNQQKMQSNKMDYEYYYYNKHHITYI